MPQRSNDSPSSDGAQLVASLLARIDQLLAQVAARDERIDELLAQVKALNARICEFEAKRGGPPKTPDNSSLPPSKGQKPERPAGAKPPRPSRPGVGRTLHPEPDRVVDATLDACPHCAAAWPAESSMSAPSLPTISVPSLRYGP